MDSNYWSRHGETPLGRAMWFPRTAPPHGEALILLAVIAERQPVGHGSVVLLFVVVERELGRIEPSKSITISLE